VCEILGAPFLFFGDFHSLLHSFSDAKGENCSGSVFFLTRSTGGNLYCYHVATPPKTHTHTHRECCAQTFILFEDLLNFPGFLCIFVHHTNLFYFLHNLSRQGEQNGPHKCLLNGRLGRGELYLYSRTGWVQGFPFCIFCTFTFSIAKRAADLLTCK